MLAHLKVPLSWAALGKRAVNEALADDVLNLAAQQAYYFFFALFPALLALISIASFFPVYNLLDELIASAGPFIPGDVLDIIKDQLQKISESKAGGVLTIAFLFTLWSTSTAIVSMVTTLNAAYDITDSRPWWKVRLLAIGLTLALATFILLSIALVIVGPRLAEQVAASMNLGPVFEWTWKILQWPLVFVLVSTAIAILYYFAPDAEQHWVWITPGSIVATVLWLLVSLALKVYLVTMGNFTETYGAIGGVMVLMLWFYLSGIAILMGAELNAEIEHASPYGKDVGEKVPGQKKKIGVAAMKAYEERRVRGEMPAPVFAEDENCDLERAAAEPARNDRVRPSDLIIATAALLPAAVKVAREVKKKVEDRDAA